MVLVILLLVHRSYVDKNILLGKSPDIPIINATAQIWCGCNSGARQFFFCVSARLLVPLRMNFIHYLYAKGETVFSPRLGGRGLFIAPIWFLSIISTTPFMPLGIEQFSFIFLSLCWLGILIGVSYILIPKKEAETKLKSWVRKYKKTTTLWAYLYLLSPILFLFYLFIS